MVGAQSGAVLALGRATAELRYTVDTFDGRAQVNQFNVVRRAAFFVVVMVCL